MRLADRSRSIRVNPRLEKFFCLRVFVVSVVGFCHFALTSSGLHHSRYNSLNPAPDATFAPLDNPPGGAHNPTL
jgi:hypothetical protein